MNPVETNQKPRLVAEHIPGYYYGAPSAARSPISLEELELLKQSAGFTAEDEGWLRISGEVLRDHTKQLVEQWSAAIAAHPHLVKYSKRPDGEKDPAYSEKSGLRFQQWILDTCLRPYNQDWLNYQQEIALRHTSVKKNKTDSVESVPTIHLRHLLAFNAVISDPNIMKPFLAARGHSADDVDRMHRAWMKSLWLQAALWTEPYTNPALAPNEW